MTATSATNPGTIIDDNTIGTVAWSFPNNAKTSDNVYATTDASTGTLISHYIKATNFGFNIPSGATINGIGVEIEKKRRSGTYEEIDYELWIVKADGTLGNVNKADTGTNWGTTDAYYGYGGVSDLWGESWDNTKINNINFGIIFSAITNINYSQAYIDHIRITVYYTPLPFTLQGTSGQKEISSNYPVIDGLIAGTTTQVGHEENLKAEIVAMPSGWGSL